MKKRCKRLLSLLLSASLCLGLLQISGLAAEGSPPAELREAGESDMYVYEDREDAGPSYRVERRKTEKIGTYVYGNGEDATPLILEQVYVSMKSPVDNEKKQAWHSVGMISLKIEGFGMTEEELKEQLRGKQGNENAFDLSQLSEEQLDGIKVQVLDQTELLNGPATEEILKEVRWTELKYEQNDENKGNICPWHLDGEIEFYPTAFFLRKDQTIPGGAQPEAQYYPSHTEEWNSLTWGLLKGFADPQKDGYHVVVDDLETKEEIEAVKQVFAAVDQTIVVGPDLRNDKTCPLRKTIMDNYRVKATDLDNGVVDVIWYVSKRGENCSSPCIYHVDGVVYNTLTHGIVDPEESRGSLEVIHRYYSKVGGKLTLKGEVNEGTVEVQADKTIKIDELVESKYQGTEYPFVSATVNDAAVETVSVGPKQTVTVVLTYILTEPEPTPPTPPTPVKYLLQVDHRYFVQYINEAGENVGGPEEETEKAIHIEDESDIAKSVTIGELKQLKDGYTCTSHTNDGEEIAYGENKATTVLLTYVRTEVKKTTPSPSPSETVSPPPTATESVSPSPSETTSPPPTATPSAPPDDEEDDLPSPPPTTAEPTPVPSQSVEPTPPPTAEPAPPVEDFEETDVPLAGSPDALPPDHTDEELLEDPDIPLAQVPETGDDSKLWLAAMLSTALGLAWLAVGKKREPL